LLESYIAHACARTRTHTHTHTHTHTQSCLNTSFSANFLHRWASQAVEEYVILK